MKSLSLRCFLVLAFTALDPFRISFVVEVIKEVIKENGVGQNYEKREAWILAVIDEQLA